ncbi:MAG: RNA polymerase subunit sigma-24, partial [Planctomycetes bacterium]|nr:RNA polymerase subunit sigma-24 [Planctomycetota bacterium]
DLSRETIATITGLPQSVVKSRLYEGLEKLRERLGRGE